MFGFTLIALAAVAGVIFSVPTRWKSRTALLIVAAGVLLPAAKAVGVLLDPASGGELWLSQNPIFGSEGCSMDTLSALFVLIIALGGVATSLYACGYLKHYEESKSSAHFSLHCLSLVVLIFSMMGVVVADGGYTFLFYWELMTIASFLLILYAFIAWASGRAAAMSSAVTSSSARMAEPSRPPAFSLGAS